MRSKRSSPYLNDLGKHLKVIRQEKGFTQRSLAYDSNVTQSYIAQIEKGTVAPSVIILKQLADALEVHPQELLAF